MGRKCFDKNIEKYIEVDVVFSVAGRLRMRVVAVSYTHLTLPTKA